MIELIIVLVAGGATCVFILGYRKYAYRLDLLDYPGGHKLHGEPTPLVGGLAMFSGFFVTLLILPLQLSDYRSLFAASVLLVVVGVLDDLHELSSWARFVAQIGAALLMCYWGGVIIYDLGALVGDSIVVMGYWAIPFTIFSTVGVINAINMSDGMNGQAGGLSLVAVISLIVLSILGSRIGEVMLLFVLVGVIVAFLAFNLKSPLLRKVVFMGDAGSLFIGFMLTWFLITLSQGDNRIVSPVSALWILAVPLLDTVGIMFHRLLKLQSPFRSDRMHIHHILQNMGLSANTAMIGLIAASIVLSGFGIYGYVVQLAESTMLNIFLVLFAFYYSVMSYLWARFGSSDLIAKTG
ncbi:MAG TPA: undecaprenyl/decaprenyl-phosphate alpha-N-acetylglucosaminyl 1-phosphate transferase [Gammaproteobacteria bacterium]|nr:undecaprenyl/decaprenyl-phosphate alpha-N-acetylglucosaminyl 1-phosphate transferase [Gammaproteobacteria bacterium]